MKWSVQNASKGVSEPFSPLSILHLVIGRAFHCVLLSFLPGTKHVFCYWLVFLSVACIESVKCGSSRKTSERNKYLTILLSIVIDTQGGHSPGCALPGSHNNIWSDCNYFWENIFWQLELVTGLEEWGVSPGVFVSEWSASRPRAVSCPEISPPRILALHLNSWPGNNEF